MTYTVSSGTLNPSIPYHTYLALIHPASRWDALGYINSDAIHLRQWLLTASSQVSPVLGLSWLRLAQFDFGRPSPFCTLAPACCNQNIVLPLIMRPSSLGGGRILRRTLSVRLSVCLSVRPSRYRYRASRRATWRITMTHMYFSTRAEGRISYGHLGRTDSCFIISCPEIGHLISLIPSSLMSRQRQRI